MSGADLAFLVPLWKRTRNIERVYGAVRSTTPDARVLFVVSADDADVLDALDTFGLADASVLVVDDVGGAPGDYARKINAGYRATTEAFVFTGADDVVPHLGWYEAARALSARCPHGDEACPCQDGIPGGPACHYAGADPMTCPTTEERGCATCRPIGVVGTVDLCNGRTTLGRHSTHSLVARWYADLGGSVDRAGAIYYDGYTHEYCDDEMVRTAMFRGAYAHAFDSIVEHMHMLRDRSLDDETYRRGRAANHRNKALFVRRRYLWGDSRSGRTQYPRPIVRRR